MMTDLFVRLIFLLSVLMPFITILLYGSILFYHHLRSQNKFKKELVELPNITILLPTHNEEKIISKRIEHLFNHGYECLIIWAEELRYPSFLKSKIVQFEHREGICIEILESPY